MPVKVGFLSVAHMHAYGYAGGLKRIPDCQVSAVWDPDPERASGFAKTFGAEVVASAEQLAESVDAVIVTSDNMSHVQLVEVAAKARKPVLCEKPLVATEPDAAKMLEIVRSSGIQLMTAFPCRYASAFLRMKAVVRGGRIGEVMAVCATNHGMCPFGWFVEKDKSGGGSMIDHVVHVADLLYVLFGEEPTSVFAQIGNKMYDQDWEDTAMLTLGYPSGWFATLDSSWSRPKPFKTWGDVTMNIVGTEGVAEMDMFAQAVEAYHDDIPSYSAAGYGSDMDAGLVADFLRVVRGEITSPIPVEDGIRAAKVALAGYRSVESGKPVALDG